MITSNGWIYCESDHMDCRCRNVALHKKCQQVFLSTNIGKPRQHFLCGLQLFCFLECRGSQECITLVKFNSTLWEDYELDIPESCIFPYWRNNKPANGNTQQTTHCSGKKTCKVSRFTKHKMHCWLNIWLIGTRNQYGLQYHIDQQFGVNGH